MRLDVRLWEACGEEERDYKSFLTVDLEVDGVWATEEGVREMKQVLPPILRTHAMQQQGGFQAATSKILP